MNYLRVFAKYKEGKKPSYGSKLASGADLFADLEEPITLEPFERALIPTGVFIELPEGFEAQIRPRSGLAVKNGITVLNTPGTIDEDYRGEIKIVLINLGSENFVVNDGDRIAQMIIAPYIQADFVKSEKFSDTERGNSGFGSTGV